MDNVDQLPDLPVAEIHQRNGEWLAERLAGEDVLVTVETQARTEQRELPCPIPRVEGTESDRYTVVGFWPGHSMGRYTGSARYADQNWLDLRENGIAYIHIDLNGLDGADHLWAQHMAEVGDEHVDALENGPLPLKTARDEGGLHGGGNRPGRNSDQSFWGAGLSSLLSGARFSTDHKDTGPVGGSYSRRKSYLLGRCWCG